MVLHSHSKNADGSPRFRLPLLREHVSDDPGVHYIVVHESFYGGYEATTRLFYDEHLEPGDVFVDVGAHWGVFALSAATRWRGQLAVVAVEPHPLNTVQLLKSLEFNSLGDQIDVVTAAAGAARDMGILRCATSMGHTLDDTAPHAGQVALHVPVVPLDDLVVARQDLRGRRVFMKIDVEGYELEVLQGARQLLASGQVQAIMWEKGISYGSGAGRDKLALLVQELEAHGFSLHRFPSNEFGGPLIPFAPTLETGNVFALAPGFERRAIYAQPFAYQPPFNRLFALPSDPVARARTTHLLQEVRGSDGARWSDAEELIPGAEARAQAAARRIEAGSRVLDLGAGTMALAKVLAPECTYVPADLVARSDDCHVVDVNQGQFPQGRYDVVTLLEVLEYVHDIPPLLERVGSCAERLICSYHVRGHETANERRQHGWFNDFSDGDIARMLAQARWRIVEQAGQEFGTLYSCRAADG